MSQATFAAHEERPPSPSSNVSLRDKIRERERLTEASGHYWGVTELTHYAPRTTFHMANKRGVGIICAHD